MGRLEMALFEAGSKFRAEIVLVELKKRRENYIEYFSVAGVLVARV